MKNLHELIEELQNLIDTGECDGSEMVLFAHQPRYPLQCSIDGPNVVDEGSEDIIELEEQMSNEDDQETLAQMSSEMDRLKARATKTVYLCEGGWRPRRADGSEISPYAPREAWGE